MLNDVLIHNPRCSKSRKTLELLNERDAKLSIREYLKEPLSVEELKYVTELLGVPVLNIVRTKEDLFSELSLDGASDEKLYQALAENPKLLERPIAIHGGKAVIGRPPENIDKLF